jgi:hypothetical protein
MTRFILAVFCCLLLFPFYVAAQSTPGQPSQTKAAEENILAVNTSQFGVKYPEKFVLLQNRMGIRVEYVVDRGRMQLWISPQAGKSMRYKDRNFSNRDDHSDIFERILLPQLSPGEFVKCDYDPFHSVLHFKNQTLHLAHV